MGAASPVELLEMAFDTYTHNAKSKVFRVGIFLFFSREPNYSINSPNYEPISIRAAFGGIKSLIAFLFSLRNILTRHSLTVQTFPCFCVEIS